MNIKSSITLTNKAINNIVNVSSRITSTLKAIDDSDPILHHYIKPSFLKKDGFDHGLLSYQFVDMGGSGLAQYGNYYHTCFSLGFVLSAAAYDSVCVASDRLIELFKQSEKTSQSVQFADLKNHLIDNNSVRNEIKDSAKNIIREIPENLKHKSTNQYVIPSLDYDQQHYIDKNVTISGFTQLCYAQACNQLNALIRFVSHPDTISEISTYMNKFSSAYDISEENGDKLLLSTAFNIGISEVSHRELDIVCSQLEKIEDEMNRLDNMKLVEVYVPE